MTVCGIVFLLDIPVTSETYFFLLVGPPYTFYIEVYTVLGISEPTKEVR